MEDGHFLNICRNDVVTHEKWPCDPTLCRDPHFGNHWSKRLKILSLSLIPCQSNLCVCILTTWWSHLWFWLHNLPPPPTKTGCGLIGYANIACTPTVAPRPGGHSCANHVPIYSSPSSKRGLEWRYDNPSVASEEINRHHSTCTYSFDLVFQVADNQNGGYSEVDFSTNLTKMRTSRHRVAASTLPRYSFGLRLAIAQVNARSAMPVSFR